MPDQDEKSQGGYAEGGPGRGDYAGRGDGTSTRPQSDAEDELSERSRWRDADRDERSDRWSEKTDDALDPDIPKRDEAGTRSDPGQDGNT